MSRRTLTITKLRRDPVHGYWTARITGADGVTVDVDRSAGSWLYPVQGEPGFFRELPRDVCRALQEKVRRLERAESRSEGVA